MPYFTAGDGTRLFYSDCGAGAPVVFLSSWAFSSDMWAYQTDDLVRRGLRCVAPDRRGHGRSDQPGGGYDYDTLADDVAALLAHLDLRGVTLVGHSMGGAEVVRYLSRHGAGRVARAALVGAMAPFLLATADNPDGIDAGVLDAVRAEMRRDFPRWLAANADAFFGAGSAAPSISPERVQWQIRDALRTPLRVAIALNHAATETDLRAEMAALPVPTLIVHGDADSSAPLALTGRRSAALIPCCRLVVYEGAPHGLYLTHARRLNDDLLAFARG